MLDESQQRLDLWLVKHYPGFSRGYFQEIIRDGLVQVNGERVKKRHFVSENDQIDVQFRAQLDQTSLAPQYISLDVLFEDHSILVINKPAGLVVHPGAGNWSHTFVNALLHHCQSISSLGDLRPGIVHRLDKSTTGVLIAAKSATAQQNLISQFAERCVRKEYLAIVHSRPNALVATFPIGRDIKNRKRMAAVSSGKTARTDFEILATRADLSLIKARPVTGRTHQIRVHLSALHAPIVGDSLYGGRACPGWDGYFLHAWKLHLAHPASGIEMEFCAPLPDHFSRFAQARHLIEPKYRHSPTAF